MTDESNTHSTHHATPDKHTTASENNHSITSKTSKPTNQQERTTSTTKHKIRKAYGKSNSHGIPRLQSYGNATNKTYPHHSLQSTDNYKPKP
jgi:hypothetical protein